MTLSRALLSTTIIIWSIGGGIASADFLTWTGAGANNNFSTAANWNLGKTPQTGDTLFFPAQVLNKSGVNDLPDNVVIASLGLEGDYTISGGPLAISSAIGIGPGHDVTVSCSLVLSGLTVIQLDAAVGAVLTLESVISGATGLVKTGTGTVILAGQAPNTFAGRTIVNEGVLVLQQGNAADPQPNSAVAIPNGLTIGDDIGGPNSDVVLLDGFDQVAGDVTVASTGIWNFNNFFSNVMTGSLTIKSGRIKADGGSLILGGDVIVPDGSNGGVITGNLDLGTATRTFTIGSGIAPELDIQAVISAPAGPTVGLVKTGPGVLQLSGANSFPGIATLQSGPVHATHFTAFGSPDSATVVEGQAVLHFDTNNGTLEPLVLDTDSSLPALECDGNGTRTWVGAITLKSAANRFATTPGCELRLGDIAGTGDVIIDDHGNGIAFVGVATHSGKTIVASGVLRPVGSSRLSPSSDVILQSTVLDLQAGSQSTKSLQGTGQMVLANDTLKVLMPDNSDAIFAGVISGAGTVHKSGVGHWTLTGANTFAGTTRVGAGELVIDGSITGPVDLNPDLGLHGTVNGTGTLSGIGSVGTIGGNGGRLQPGRDHEPGRLTSQSIVLSAGLTFGVTVNGTAPGTGYSQLIVHGGVDLGGAQLALAVIPGAVPGGSADLVLIDNDGTDPVVGTFAGLAEGAIVTAPSGATFRISYVGGTGNDVTLTPRANEYFLSEGSTGVFFDTDILIANPNADPAPITLTFLKDDGTTVTQDRVLPATSRTTIRVDDIAGMESTAFSTIVTSHAGLPLAVERTMQWDQSAYGGHTERAVAGAAQTWYFAEGSEGYFSTFLLLANPQSAASVATVQYLLEGAPAVVRTYPIPPTARVSIDVGSEPALRARSFGMIVNFSVPGVAERAMYFGTDPLWKGGHESAGVNAPANSWYVAEGATGTYFTTFLLLANPGDIDAQATLTFLPDTGARVTSSKTVPAHGRVTVNIAQEDPSLASAAVASMVTTTGAPILVERSQYWPFTPDQWQEPHNSFGVSAPGTKWGLAEGRVGGPQAYQTYILLANPNAVPASATIMFLRENGAPISKAFTIGPMSRLNVPVGPGTSVPELVDERFGAVVTSDQAIAVERSMYWNANGIVWTAGTSATGTPLP
jgi:autotransporter-associated beta strand protein